MTTKSKEHCLVSVEAKKVKTNIKSNQVEAQHTETYFNVKLLNMFGVITEIKQLLSLFKL